MEVVCINQIPSYCFPIRYYNSIEKWVKNNNKVLLYIL